MKKRIAILVLLGMSSCIYIQSGPWTPTFDGNRFSRFKQGVLYYRQRMGITYSVEFVNEHMVGLRGRYCAWVRRDIFDNRLMVVGLSTDVECAAKPEWYALHEACHMRMAHTDAAFENTLTHEQKEAEANRCMGWYGKEEEQ